MMSPNKKLPLLQGPLLGRTYSLHGGEQTSESYYAAVAELAEECLHKFPGEKSLLENVRQASRSKRGLRRLVKENAQGSPATFALATASRLVNRFLLDVDAYCSGVPLRDRCSSTLTTTREQLLLHALEIELTNRVHGPDFRNCRTKIAFLPHCLRDLSATCKATPKGLDHVCMVCSPKCYLNAVSRLLRHHRVQPYIWMNASLRKLLRSKDSHDGGLGILGIACIPELVSGMRACSAAVVPVVGLPLDANRCPRWMGEFHENSINLRQLEALVSSSQDGVG